MPLNVWDELKERGYIAQCTNEEEVRKLLAEEKITFYIGFDPTADSLHVGHFLALMAILGIITLYKILEVSVLHRILLQGKVHIRPQVIDPDLFGLHIGARGTLIEKDDIRLDAGLVKDTGGQA